MENKTNYKKSDHTDVFGIAKNENNKYNIVCGKYIAVEKEFETIKEAEDYIKNTPYELTYGLICIILSYEKETNEIENMVEKNHK